MSTGQEIRDTRPETSIPRLWRSCDDFPPSMKEIVVELIELPHLIEKEADVHNENRRVELCERLGYIQCQFEDYLYKRVYNLYGNCRYLYRLNDGDERWYTCDADSRNHNILCYDRGGTVPTVKCDLCPYEREDRETADHSERETWFTEYEHDDIFDVIRWERFAALQSHYRQMEQFTWEALEYIDFAEYNPEDVEGNVYKGMDVDFYFHQHCEWIRYSSTLETLEKLIRQIWDMEAKYVEILRERQENEE